MSVHPQHRDDLEQQLRSTTDQLARFAARHGLALAGVFTDIRGRTESGLYRLLAELRRRNVTAVLVPDLDHLQHTGCLAGADLRTATRYLRARVLPMAWTPERITDGAPPSRGGPVPGNAIAAGPGGVCSDRAVRS